MERKRFTSKAGIALAAGLALAAGIMLSTHAFADESEAAQIAEELGQDPVKAEEAAASEPVKQLTSSSVQVTASRVERELLEVPMSVSVITSEDIRKSPASTVGGLLQDVPGVEVVNSGAQGLKRISIRGESPHRTLVLIDGQKIAENKSMDGTPIMIDPSIIERIEVIRGPASVLYGSEAMGGVVNIITKKGGTKPIQGEAGVSFFGDTKGFAEHLSLYGKVGGFNYRLFGSYNDQGDLRTADGTQHNTSFRNFNPSAFLSYDFEKLTVGGGVDYYQSSVKAGSDEEGYENFAVDMKKWKREKYYTFAEFKGLADWMPRLRLDGFYQTNEKHMINHVDLDPDVFAMPLVTHNDADNKNSQIGFSLQSDWQIGDNHYLIAGYEYNRDKLKATTLALNETSIERLLHFPDTLNGFRQGMIGMWNAMGNPAMAGMWAAMPLDSVADSMKSTMESSSIAHHKGVTNTHALFAQMESTLPADFTLTYGVRQTWVKSKMTRAEGWKTTSRGTSENDVGTEDSSSDSRPVFNVGLVWTGIDNMSLRASFSQGFRVPTLQERFLISSMGGGTMIPNPDLDPETSNNYEIGARYAGHGLVLDVALFYSDADDYIATQYIDQAASISQYINVGSAKTHGVELFASYDLPYGFTPYVSGTWMRRKYDFGDHTTWKSGTPEWRGRAGLRWAQDVNPELTVYADAFGRFSSPWEQENSTGEISSRCNNWATANLSLGMDFGKEKEYSVGLEVLNITNERYYLSQGLQEAGTHVNARFSFRF